MLNFSVLITHTPITYAEVTFFFFPIASPTICWDAEIYRESFWVRNLQVNSFMCKFILSLKIYSQQTIQNRERFKCTQIFLATLFRIRKSEGWLYGNMIKHVNYSVKWKKEDVHLGLCCVVLSCSVKSDSLQPQGLYPTKLLCPWDSPGNNSGVGYHGLLQGIFPTQGLNPCLLHFLQAGYLPLVPPGLKPSIYIHVLFSWNDWPQNHQKGSQWKEIPSTLHHSFLSSLWAGTVSVTSTPST